MSSVTVRNLPEGVKENLALRAKQAGESLEGFLRRLLQTEAAKTDATEDWPSRIRRLVEEAKSLPPLKPGEKDFWEIIEENRAKRNSITDL
jgi:plasmid stability protein